VEPADEIDAWRPANEAELMMYHALLRSDPSRYFHTVATSELFLAAVSEPARRLVTWDRGGRAHLLAFTSPAGLARCLGPDADTILMTSYPDLLRDWPDPDWWLAINPTLPIDAAVPVEVVGQAARDEIEVPMPIPAEPAPPDLRTGSTAGAPAPANDLEAAMAATLDDGNVALLLDLVVWAEVLLPTARPVDGPPDLRDPDFPWLALPVAAAEPSVGVFTSSERMAEATGGEAVPAVAVPLLDLVASWPGPEFALLVNPGAALRARLPGHQVAGLIDWALISARYHGLDEPPPA
jgi:hypothetical protein